MGHQPTTRFGIIRARAVFAGRLLCWEYLERFLDVHVDIFVQADPGTG